MFSYVLLEDLPGVRSAMSHLTLRSILHTNRAMASQELTSGGLGIMGLLIEPVATELTWLNVEDTRVDIVFQSDLLWRML